MSGATRTAVIAPPSDAVARLSDQEGRRQGHVLVVDQDMGSELETRVDTGHVDGDLRRPCSKVDWHGIAPESKERQLKVSRLDEQVPEPSAVDRLKPDRIGRRAVVGPAGGQPAQRQELGEDHQMFRPSAAHRTPVGGVVEPRPRDSGPDPVVGVVPGDRSNPDPRRRCARSRRARRRGHDQFELEPDLGWL